MPSSPSPSPHPQMPSPREGASIYFFCLAITVRQLSTQTLCNNLARRVWPAPLPVEQTEDLGAWRWSAQGLLEELGGWAQTPIFTLWETAAETTESLRGRCPGRTLVSSLQGLDQGLTRRLPVREWVPGSSMLCALSVPSPCSRGKSRKSPGA